MVVRCGIWLLLTLTGATPAATFTWFASAFGAAAAAGGGVEVLRRMFNRQVGHVCCR